MLSLTEAKAFHSANRASLIVSTESVREIQERANPSYPVVPTDALYPNYAAAFTADVERYLVLAATNFHRSHRLLCAYSAPWALVTMYYGAFFATKAICSLFGIELVKSANPLISVSAGATGFDILCSKPLFAAHGSHQRHWEVVFGRLASLASLLDPHLQHAFRSPGALPHYLAWVRNSVNYNPATAHRLIVDFERDFSAADPLNTLPPELAIFWDYQLVSLRAAVELAAQVGFGFGLQHLPPRVEDAEVLLSRTAFASCASFADVGVAELH